MIVINCKQPTYVDVDGTLLDWGYDEMPSPGKVEVECDGHKFYLRPIKGNIEALKAHAVRGQTIVVWSAGGSHWAEAAVKALGLEQFVTVCLEKPRWYIDDLSAEAFMGKPHFHEGEE